MKLTPDIRIRRVIVEPEDENGRNYIVAGMDPNCLKNADIRVDDAGFAYVSWLEIVPGWRNEVLLWAYGISLAVLICLLLIYFWLFGVVVLRGTGVI